MTRMRLGGINSGTDVESMVKAMGMNAQMRINNNQRRVLMLQAQQNAYREVISRLQTFQRSYFDFLNPATNLRSMTTFGQMKSTIFTGNVEATPAGVSVSTAAGATPASYDVKLITNATQTKLTGSRLVANDIDGAIDFPAAASGVFGVTVTVGNQRGNFTVDMGSGNAIAQLNEKLSVFGKNNAGQNIVQIDADGKISASDMRAVAVSNFTEQTFAQSFAGFDPTKAESGANSFNLQVGDQLTTISFNTLSGNHFARLFNANGTLVSGNAAAINTHINGINSAEKLTGDAQFTREQFDSLMTEFNNFVNTQHSNNFVAWRDANQERHTDGSFVNTDREAIFQAAWAEYSQAHPTATQSAFRTLYTIGANEYAAFNAHAGVANNSELRTLAQFRTSVTSAGSAGVIAREIEKGNQRSFDNAISQIEGLNWADGVKLKVDTTTKEIIATRPGDNDGDPRIEGDVAFSISANATSVSDLGFDNVNVFTQKTFASSATLRTLGIEDGASITVNGRKIDLTANMSMQQLATAVSNAGAGVNMNFSALSNSFNVNSVAFGTGANIDFSGTDSAILTKLGLNVGEISRFQGDGVTSNPAFSQSTPGLRQGTNLVIEVNNQRIETTGNSFTIDGTTFTFAAHAAEDTEFRVEVGRNPGAAVDAVKSFVDSYNSLIRDISLGMLAERPSTGYHFLTDWDISEMGMTEMQVSQWNTMAGKGLLYNNRTIAAVMQAMRNTLTATVGGFGIHNIVGNDGTPALRQSQNWREMGQLEFNETAFREALERDPEKIMQLFAGENGIMTRMQDEINRAINTMGPESTHGTLVRRAGLATGLTANNNALQDRIKSLNNTITTLQARHEKQQERFWRMFTNMERQFASLNAQSDQINGFFLGLFA
ncbi:MAG: flagellar filament capping protein FliD [Oscillospiraceae bacterium]|nr:flagellar filament capping protein FliD [Oscillospiraceae bacterium]